MAMSEMDYMNGGSGEINATTGDEGALSVNTQHTIDTLLGDKLDSFVCVLPYSGTNKRFIYYWDSNLNTQYVVFAYSNNMGVYTLADIRFGGGIVSVNTTTGIVVINTPTSDTTTGCKWYAAVASN